MVRFALQFISSLIVSGGGALVYDSLYSVPGKSVADVLRVKHPEPYSFGDDPFLSCDSLPPVLDVTADYVETVVHHNQEAAGIGGSTAM